MKRTKTFIVSKTCTNSNANKGLLGKDNEMRVKAYKRNNPKLKECMRTEKKFAYSYPRLYCAMTCEFEEQDDS